MQHTLGPGQRVMVVVRFSKVTKDYRLAIRYFGKPQIPENSGWWSLYRNFEKLNVEVLKPEDYEAATHLLVIDFKAKDAKNWPNLPKENRFLTATEPVTVNPIQFSNKITSKFRKIIVPSILSPQRRNSVVYEGGYLNPTRYSRAYSNDGTRSGCGLINENKFSFASESNYILRTRFIQAALNSEIALTIAGRNWNRGFLWTLSKLVHHFLISIRAKQINFNFFDVVDALKFSFSQRSVRKMNAGVVPDNVKFLSGFKVAIVIENESSYVSEKLHAALIAGCQCVYVGPELNPLEFPKGFLFQSEPSAEAILQKAKLALQTPYAIQNKELEKIINESEFFDLHGVERRNSWIAKSIFTWMNTPFDPSKGLDFLENKQVKS